MLLYIVEEIMIIEKIECGALAQNTYFVCDAYSAVLIDASAKVQDVKKLIDIYSVPLKAIFITHAHFDHILHLDELIQEFGCEVYIHDEGKDLLIDENKNLSFIDIPFTVQNVDKIRSFSTDDSISGVFDRPISTLYTPGHSLDSVCYKIEDVVFTGDTLFLGTVGRTDMFGGSPTEQKQSLFRLSEFIKGATRFCAGHGEDFTYDEALETIEYYSK